MPRERIIHILFLSLFPPCPHQCWVHSRTLCLQSCYWLLEAWVPSIEKAVSFPLDCHELSLQALVFHVCLAGRVLHLVGAREFGVKKPLSKIWLQPCVLGFSRETKPPVCFNKHINEKIYYGELVRAIVEAEKSQNLLSASWRPRKASGIISVWVRYKS